MRDMSNTIGVIGGADGPTTIFLSGEFPTGIILLGGVVLLGLVAVAIALARK